MEAEARYTYVGAAVLLLIAALVAGVVWLKDVGGRGSYYRYAIYFEHQALDGLQIGADVNVRGIKVGRVEDYALSDDKVNRVRVEIRVDRRVPVRTNTVAVVTRNFVTGIASIALVHREPPGKPLVEATAEGDTYPVIREGRSDIDEIAGRVSQVGEQATAALASINHLLTPQNRDAVMDTVRNLRDLSAGLTQRLAALDRTLDRAGAAAASIGVAAGRLGEAGERVARVAEQAGGRLDATLEQTERTLADARSAIDRVATSLDTVARQAGATAGRLEQSAGHVDDQLTAAMSELRLSMEAATRVLDRLRDPRAALLGPGSEQLGPGERKP
jgi:phospholipid/cholesterol/gamma-HCH transport system substrate-binding protein